MRGRTVGAVAVAMALAACAVEGPTPSPRYGLRQADGALALGGASATSTGLWQGRYYEAGRAIDGNTDTEWGSTTVDPAPALTAQLGGPSYVARLRIKTWPGSRFVIELSPDNATWSATDPRRSGSWDMEEQAVGLTGQYLRIRFVDGPPPGAEHRSIFEIEAYGYPAGGGGGGGYPRDGRLTFLGTREDRVGPGSQAYPNGYPDGRFRLVLDLAAPTEIRGFELEEVTRGARTPTGAHWSSRQPGYWLLGVEPIAGFRPTLGWFGAGRETFDLYAENYGAVFTGGGNEARLTVDFAGGSRTFFVPLPD